MSDDGQAPQRDATAGRDGGPGVRRFTIALTRRELPSPLINIVLRALTNHEPPELRAVFIEDADLLNAVALPFTHELCVLTHAMRPIDRARLEAHFQRESAAAAAGVADLTRVLGWQCHFEVLRARKGHALRATLEGADAVLIPGAQSAAPQSQAAPLLAVLDDSASAEHCRALATRLALAVGASLQVCQVVNGGTAQPGSVPVALKDVPALLARREPRLVLLAAALVPRLAHNLAELDEMCAAPLLVVN
jgi:hypothetical protein